MNTLKTLVMKFGGEAVATSEQFITIADLIISRQTEFPRIVVVVSAMKGMTDQLIELAKKVHPEPPQREYDMLISVGERMSMSLLAMALCYRNQDAVSFTGSQSGIITTNDHSHAKVVKVRPERIQNGLDSGKIVIVAGFQGVSETKEITTLGRGGSDLTAVALGLSLQAEKVEFFKDVPGVFDRDPKHFHEASCFSFMNYQQALDVVDQGARILHRRAIELAAKNALPLHVRSFMSSYCQHPGTIILDPERQRCTIPEYEQA
jgi:aspartate kinase